MWATVLCLGGNHFVPPWHTFLASPKNEIPKEIFFCTLFVLSRKGGQEVGFQAGHWMSEIPVRYRGWAHRWQWSRLYAEMGSSERKSDVVVIGMFCEIFEERRGAERSRAELGCLSYCGYDRAWVRMIPSHLQGHPLLDGSELLLANRLEMWCSKAPLSTASLPLTLVFPQQSFDAPKSSRHWNLMLH